MDLKFIEFEKRVPEEFRLGLFKETLNIINDTDCDWENLNGKMVKIYHITFNPNDKFQVSIVKNKTCYTIYIHKK